MLLLGASLNYMAVGILVWYQVLWLRTVCHCSPLRFAMGWTPCVIWATGPVGLAAWLIPRLAAQWILVIGTVRFLVSNTLIATVRSPTPTGRRYPLRLCSFHFPGTLCISLGRSSPVTRCAGINKVLPGPLLERWVCMGIAQVLGFVDGRDGDSTSLEK